MDSNYSQFFGEAEECNSSESGWTMYIGSPSTGDDNGDFDELENNYYNNKEARVNRDDDEGGDTDDSMASDASSGPISYFSRNGKSTSGGVAVVSFKISEEKGKGKDCSRKAKRSMKNGYKNDQDKLKESFFAAKGSTKGASNGSGNKVRRSIWMGKGK